MDNLARSSKFQLAIRVSSEKGVAIQLPVKDGMPSQILVTDPWPHQDLCHLQTHPSAGLCWRSVGNEPESVGNEPRGPLKALKETTSWMVFLGVIPTHPLLTKPWASEAPRPVGRAARTGSGACGASGRPAAAPAIQPIASAGGEEFQDQKIGRRCWCASWRVPWSQAPSRQLAWKCKKALSKRKVVFLQGRCTSMLAGGRASLSCWWLDWWLGI